MCYSIWNILGWNERLTGADMEVNIKTCMQCGKYCAKKILSSPKVANDLDPCYSSWSWISGYPPIFQADGSCGTYEGPDNGRAAPWRPQAVERKFPRKLGRQTIQNQCHPVSFGISRTDTFRGSFASQPNGRVEGLHGILWEHGRFRFSFCIRQGDQTCRSTPAA